MPSLINSDLAQNYRKSRPSTRLGTPQLIHALITIDVVDVSDYNTVDGNFYNLISIIQKYAEIYAIGDVQYGEGASTVAVILKGDTITSLDFALDGPSNVNLKAGQLDSDLSNYFDESVTVNYTTMYGLQYD